MSNFINQFTEHNQRVLNFRNQIIENYKDADSIIQSFKKFLIDSMYNPALGTDLTTYLQLLSKKENFSDFELEELDQLFDSLIRLQESNIETYVEAGNFQWSVMNNKSKSIEIIETGIKEAKKRLEELIELLESVKRED